MEKLNITLAMVLEYEAWIHQFNEYLQKEENRNLNIYGKQPVTFQDISINGQDFGCATGGYAIGINKGSFDGFYNYLIQKYRNILEDEE